MFLLVARSIAVYGGTAALFLYIAHRWVLPLRLRVAFLIAAAPLLFTGRATLTGGVYAPLDILYHYEPFRSHRQDVGMTAVQTPLLSDVVFSMIPWQKAVREGIKNGHAPVWNRFVLAGEPLLAVQQPAVFHPLTGIGFLLPLAQSWTFQMSARLLIALLSAFLFFRELGCRETAALVGAFGWSFSDFMIFWTGYPVGNSLGPFPLLLLGLHRLAKDRDRRAVVLTVVALVLIVAAGHPETLLFAVIGAGLYFLFLLGLAARGRRVRPVLLALSAGMLALGLTAVQLLPLAEALPHTWEHALRSQWYAHVRKSVGLTQSVAREVPNLLPFVYGESGHGQIRQGFGVPAAYAGALLLPLAWVGLLSRDRRRWAFLAMGLFGIALWAHLAVLTEAVTALPPLNIAVIDYMIFLAAFALSALAALGAERLRNGEGRPAFFVGTVLSLAAIAALYGRFEPEMKELGMPGDFLHRRLALEMAPLCAGALAIAVLRRDVAARAGTAALLVFLIAARVAEASGIYPTCPDRAFFPRLPVLDPVPRGAPDRLVALGFTLIPNAAALYEVEDVRGYESMTFRPFYETYPLWCTPQGSWFNLVDDLERPFLSFLNVRYAVVPAGHVPPAGWRILSRDAGTELLENTRALPRAFVPEWIKSESQPARRIDLLKSISDFRERGVLASESAASSREWMKNGRARLAIRSYRPPSMALDVDALEDVVIGTSVTAWPGWKTRLDGKAVEPLAYNHAFLAFRVPRGRHRLEMRYLPDGFVLGSAVSLATLAVSALLLRRRGVRSANV
jgi:hypothetical protein